MRPRFIMIGGFLGAGKTTTIGRLARHFAAQGKNVAIVTNDQTTDLVDTHSLRSQGFHVGEVTGSCFCCNFNELTATVERLSSRGLPDVVLAEPVGSCTDLVATVIRPLAQVYRRPLDIAPYGVILKPSHGAKILGRDPRGGFSPQAAYIFRKQVEEADLVVVNRIDELSPSDVAGLVEAVEREFPGRPVLRMSARTGEGFDAFCEFLEQRGDFGRRLVDVDYDVYAEGEAELGWLNCQVQVQGARLIELDEFLVELIGRLKTRLAEAGAETAHLKVIGMAEGQYAVANLVSSFTDPELSLPCRGHVMRADLVINARVAIAPEELVPLVEAELAAVCEAAGLTHRVNALKCFRPGRPVPTHRLLAR
jgi:Ni2+-binding GTPase involved in maturation of urease and hydrogenase